MTVTNLSAYISSNRPDVYGTLGLQGTAYVREVTGLSPTQLGALVNDLRTNYDAFFTETFSHAGDEIKPKFVWDAETPFASDLFRTDWTFPIPDPLENIYGSAWDSDNYDYSGMYGDGITVARLYQRYITGEYFGNEDNPEDGYPPEEKAKYFRWIIDITFQEGIDELEVPTGIFTATLTLTIGRVYFPPS